MCVDREGQNDTAVNVLQCISCYHVFGTCVVLEYSAVCGRIRTVVDLRCK